METEINAELNTILRQYSLGRLVDYERNDRGFVNTSFAIETELDGCRHAHFLRRYKQGIKEEELEFEHSVLRHLAHKGFPYAANVADTNDGRSYVRLVSPAGEATFYAIFDFLPGEDCYTWIGPLCTRQEIVSSAACLAEYHQAILDLQPRGWRHELVILDLLDELAARLRGILSQSKGAVFDDCLRDNLPLMMASTEATRQALSNKANRQFVRLAIHCDYHPGNLKYRAGQVTGLFDFDWSKLDWRVFDLGLALWYFFASWEGEQDGNLRLDEVAAFLSAYRQAFTGPPGPLNQAEIDYLPQAISAGNLYVLNWTILDYYQKEVDAQEYLKFLLHSIRTIQWFDKPANRQALQAVVADTCH